MSIKITGYAFVLAILVGACSQTPSKSPLPDSVSKALDSPAASIDDAAKNTVIEKIMAESGWNEMIEQMSAMAVMNFDQEQPPPVNRRNYEKFRAALLQTFDADRIRKTIVDHLNEHYESKRFSELLALVRTPLAQKMTALEIEASSPQAQQEMMQIGNIIMGQASPGRLELARKLDEATSATETLVDMQVMMSEVMMTNMNKIVPPAQRMTKAQLEQVPEQVRLRFLFPARQLMQLSIIYAYRSVSDEELEQYTQLYQTETGRGSTEMMRKAWMKVSEDISTDLAQRMKNTFIENNAF